MLDNSHLYERYRVEISICERLDGGVPKDPKLIESWVKARTGYDDELTKQQIEEHMPDVESAADEIAAPMWCGFKQTEGRPYLDARQVKAMLRECATVLGIIKKKTGSRQIIQHGFEVKGTEHASRIYFRDVQNTGTEESAIHVMTPKGPRNALKRNDYVGEGTRLVFIVWILKTHHSEKRHIGINELREMLTLAQENGLGANRSQGCGKFVVEVFEQLPE